MHVTHLIILFVTNYYATIKHDVDIEVKSKLNIAANIEIGCIIFSFIVSALVFYYEFFICTRDYCYYFLR